MTYISKRKVRVGEVVSDKMDKTVVVVVETLKHHPLYQKAVRHTKKYKVHDANKICRVGDRVKIIETRPLSREKKWQVAEIVSRKETAKAEQSGIRENDTDLHQTQSS